VIGCLLFGSFLWESKEMNIIIINRDAKQLKSLRRHYSPSSGSLQSAFPPMAPGQPDATKSRSLQRNFCEEKVVFARSLWYIALFWDLPEMDG
jgi:hypothetical protein